jgi:hypothetical protein
MSSRGKEAAHQPDVIRWRAYVRATVSSFSGGLWRQSYLLSFTVFPFYLCRDTGAVHEYDLPDACLFF